MPVATITLEVDTATGNAKLQETAGKLDQVGGKAKSAGDAIKNGFLERIGHRALDGLLAALKSLPSAMLANVQAVIDYGGKLVDLEAKTGIAVEAQQKLKHAGNLVGVSFESDVVPAIAKMQKALVDTPEKFQRLGLSIEALRKMKPEDQFVAIGERIGQIQDPAQRATAAMEIFGKAGATLLPLFTSNVREAMEEAERLGLVMSKDVAGAADDLGDAIDTLTAIWDGLLRNFGAAIVTSEPLHRLINGLAELLGKASKAAHDNRTALQQLVDHGIVFLAKALSTMGRVVALAVDGWTSLKLTWMSATKIALDLAEASSRVEQANALKDGDMKMYAHYEKQIELIRKKREALSGEANDLVESSNKQAEAMGVVVRELEALQRNVERGVGLTHKAAAADRTHTGVLGEKAAAMKLMDAHVREYEKSLDKLVLTEMAIAKAWREAPVRDLGDIGAHATGAPGAGRDPEAEAEAEQKVLDKLVATAEMLREIDRLWDALGVSADSNLRKVTQGLSELADIGVDFMAAFFSPGGPDIMGMVTAGIAGVTSLVRTFKSIFDGGEHAKVNDMRDGLMEAAGGFDALAARAAAAGLTIKHVLDARTVKDYEEAVETLNTAMEFVEAQGGLEALRLKAAEAGISLDDLFDATTARELEDAIHDIKAALDLHAEAHQKLDEAVKRYGFTIEELGPKFRAQELDKMAAQLYQDFELLKASGIDQAVILERMGPALSDYVNTAVRAGVEVPEAMRPMIEAAIENGELLDENGRAYGSAEEAGIVYGKTMTQMFTDLIKKVDEWISKILGIPAERETTVTVRRRDPDNLLGGGGGGDDDEDYGGKRGRRNNALGFDGWILPGSPAMNFAEAGRPEYVYASPNGPPTGFGGGALLAELRAQTRAIEANTAAVNETRADIRRDRLALPALVNGQRALAAV